MRPKGAILGRSQAKIVVDVAEVTQPILGNDFFIQHNLAIYPKGKCLIDLSDYSRIAQAALCKPRRAVESADAMSTILACETGARSGVRAPCARATG